MRHDIVDLKESGILVCDASSGSGTAAEHQAGIAESAEALSRVRGSHVRLSSLG